MSIYHHSQPGAGSDSDPKKTWTVWRYLDGKPGHENQSAGLLDALGELVPVKVIDQPALKAMHAVYAALVKKYPQPWEAQPDLVVAAGHATHLSALAAARVFSVPSIILMKPSLPSRWFDLCFVPEHDRVIKAAHIIMTKGVLNKIRFSEKKNSSAGLFLIGGPSRHYCWDNATVIKQVSDIMNSDNIKGDNINKDKFSWTLTTSRRTPEDFLGELKKTVNQRLNIVPVEQTDSDWMRSHLAVSSTVWITEDSVSMVYEALSAGSACGLLSLQAKPANKIQAGLAQLLDEKLLLSFDQWKQGMPMQATREKFNEAERCAKLVFEKWIKKA